MLIITLVDACPGTVLGSHPSPDRKSVEGYPENHRAGAPACRPLQQSSALPCQGFTWPRVVTDIGSKAFENI